MQEAPSHLPAVLFLLWGEAASHRVMQMTGSRPKGQKTDILAIEDLANHVHQLLGNKEHRRRQEEYPFRGNEIKMLRNVRDGLSQGRHRLVDVLEMERFLIAVRDLMEHRNTAYSLLACIEQGKAAPGDIGLAPGRKPKHHDFFLQTGNRFSIDEQAHEPGLE